LKDNPLSDGALILVIRFEQFTHLEFGELDFPPLFAVVLVY